MKRIDVADSFASGRPGAGYRSNYHFTRLYVVPIFLPIDHNILAEPVSLELWACLFVHEIDRTEKLRLLNTEIINTFCLFFSDTD